MVKVPGKVRTTVEMPSGCDAYPQRRCLVSRSSSRLLSTRTFSTRRRSDATARCSGTTRCLGCSLASTKSERRCIRGILRCWCVQSSRKSTPSACVLTLLCCRSRRGLGRGCGPLALISPHAALGLTGTPRTAPQFNKGGYLLLDSLIMRGAYGPYGPAKTQVRELAFNQAIVSCNCSQLALL